MSDYIPVEVIVEILKRLPVKSLVRFRSVCKSWNTLISHSSFISTHLQASLSNYTPFLLLSYRRNSKYNFFLHYDNDGFDEFKQLQFPAFGCASFSLLLGSCNGLIYLQFWKGDVSKFLLWNPSIQKCISLPRPRFSDDVQINFGFGFDSITNDYKLVIIGFEKDDAWIKPFLFSLNENCWKRVNAIPPDYTFDPGEISVPFVNGAVHWIGYQKRNNVGFTNVILGFDLSAEEFFEISLPESLIGLGPMDLSTMKYGESSIAVLKRDSENEHELWVMKEYGVVGSWTKVLKLNRKWCPNILGCGENGEVLVELDYGKLPSLDLNCQQMELHGVEVTTNLISLEGSYVESLVLLDKAIDVQCEPLRTSLIANLTFERLNLRNHTDTRAIEAYVCLFIKEQSFHMGHGFTYRKIWILGKSWHDVKKATECARMEHGIGECFIDEETVVVYTLGNVIPGVSQAYNIVVVSS
ncbi:hypothetical protein V6N11_079265 [Hibiscus sabdariffa]|uniref:F-box domain-containing protein n=1 Tax=Hibiscus sabdariffa TaxID=183260 RepID=A0ABR2RV13_9ROSI